MSDKTHKQNNETVRVVEMEWQLLVLDAAIPC